MFGVHFYCFANIHYFYAYMTIFFRNYYYCNTNYSMIKLITFS